MDLDSLLYPDRLYSRDEVLSNPSPIPKDSGVYAWYIKEVPPMVTTDGCHVQDDKTLLYVGISPKQTPRQGKPSTQTIWHRIRYHYRGNAEGSTLRLTLGCLLSEQLDIELRRVGSGKRMTFHKGEEKINQWMQENAYVTWFSHPEPWRIEDQAISQLSLPLNLKDNKKHPFHRKLSSIRRQNKRKARALKIIES
jgi:hypothetical protein